MPCSKLEAMSRLGFLSLQWAQPTLTRTRDCSRLQGSRMPVECMQGMRNRRTAFPARYACVLTAVNAHYHQPSVPAAECSIQRTRAVRSATERAAPRPTTICRRYGSQSTATAQLRSRGTHDDRGISPS